MNPAQLKAITNAATDSSRRVRRPRTSATRCDQRPNSSTSSPIVTIDQSTRWARISIAPAGSSSGQYSGNAPHSPYAATPYSNPLRDSDTRASLGR